MSEHKYFDDGGPAFPVPEQNRLSDGTCCNEGMSLRDWFAAQALAGEFAAQNEITGEITNNTGDEWMLDRAKTLYRMADAMIAARKAGA